MKKAISLFIALILIISMPLTVTAENGQADKNENGQAENENENIEESTINEEQEVNEYGIKKGTIIYGEDISELSEEELQYVPEAWRNGEFESEHPGETELPQARIMKNYPNVNDYIKSKKLSTVKITYDYKSFFPKFNYRNGYGKPEGVVAHETANDGSTIFGEISYMSRNYQNAFVHAFVDSSHIIEIHPTEYGAWGAGRFANERFIHVELVREHSFDKFARSINNYAYYIASLLYKYNLGVKSAEKDGKGTLWSHYAVSKFLGGTNHVDPHGYFARWGYSWNEFVELVKMKYDSMYTHDIKNTSLLGHIKSSNVRIYDDLINLNDYKEAGSQYTSQVYYIKKYVTIGNTKYYLIGTKNSSSSGIVGWVNARDMTVYNHSVVDKENKTFLINGSGKAYNKPWGGVKNKVFDDLSVYQGEVFKVNLTEKVGNQYWYKGTLGGKQVWILSDYLDLERSPVAGITFMDVKKDSSHYHSIYSLVGKGAINGYTLEDGTKFFRPNQQLTRSQAAKIFTNAFNLPIPNNVNEVLKKLKDIKPTHYYAKEIAATYEAGIFRGDANGNFNDGPLTRAQMATVLVRLFDLEDTGEEVDIRLDNVTESHRESVKILKQNGLTNVVDFMPRNAVTRGQFASFLYRGMSR